jgi:hypothetical protein
MMDVTKRTWMFAFNPGFAILAEGDIVGQLLEMISIKKLIYLSINTLTEIYKIC